MVIADADHDSRAIESKACLIYNSDMSVPFGSQSLTQ